MATVGHKSRGDAQLEWMDLRAIQAYAAVSERTLREWIHREINPLPAVRVQGKILVRRTTFDRWLQGHAIVPADSIDVDATVDEILAGLKEKN